MKNVRLAVAATAAAAVTALSIGSAQAYPDAPNVTITIPSSTLIGGETLTFTANAAVDCEWTISYPEGTPSSLTGSGTSISGTFATKTVTSVFSSPITATCAYNDGTPGAASVGPAAANATASATATVTLLPAGSAGDGDADSDAGTDGDADGGGSDGAGDGGGDVVDSNGALPDAGGTNMWILVLGGAFVVAGGGAVLASRRRHTAN